MLQSFTWQQFLVAATSLTAVWYLALYLLFYRNSKVVFTPAQRIVEPLPHQWSEEYDELVDETELMGKSQLPEGVTTVSMGAFGFAPGGSNKEEQLGLVPDVLEELKRIFNILAKEDGSKADFFSLLNLVKAKYPKIASSQAVANINSYIRENAPFHLSAEELEDLWD